MAGPTELSLEAVRDFLLFNGGKVRNHDLVKYFKKFLTKPETRDDARNYFKEIVNEVAVIRHEENEKFLVLRKKYRPPEFVSVFVSPGASPSPSGSEMGSRMFFNTSATSPVGGSPRQPPPYRAPPPPDTPPVVPPRRRSSTPKWEDTQRRGSGTPEETTPKRSNPEDLGSPKWEAPENNSPRWDGPDLNNASVGADDVIDVEEQKISVKERMQKFNRMASENDGPKVPVSNSRRRLDKDDDDSSSVTSLDPKTREWLVTAARGDYQTLAKLAAESPKLVRTKTALHWAAKHGNEDLVKMVAGTFGVNPNVRTNGGYTALHLAMQFEHEEIFNLLVQVYGADQNLRDWSGRKPRQYQISLDNAVSADTFRKIKARKKHAEKESGFLRIGSLNVRVKKTTEAFSNYFLGQSSDKLHKTWGSADNVHHGDRKIMPPPKYGQIRKRKSKREADFLASRSTPGTPTQQHRVSAPAVTLSSPGLEPASSAASFASLTHDPRDPHDSDSDSAAGFGSQWKN